MRHGLKITAFMAFLALAGCDKGAPAEEAKKDGPEGPGIALSTDEVEALGITTATVAAARYRGEIRGYGVVLALDAIAQSDADILSAQAAAAQSQAAAARAQSLSTGEDAAVSREVAETAQAKAAVDQTALLLARRKSEAAFGHGGPLSGPQRSAIMARLTSGRSVLVRVTFPIGAIGNGRPTSVRLTRLGNTAQSWTADRVWEAPADATLPGRSFYALIDGSGLTQNEHVTASVPTGPAMPGITIPSRAVLLGESETWVYQEIKANTFLRTRIDISRPTADGYFLSPDSGLKPGQKIVTTGAGLLLAREINPSTEAE
jgi:hypothetical protein